MIIKSYLTNNPCYQSGRTIDVKGLMLHSVGCPQPNAEVFVTNWNQDVGACVHAFIDAINGNVYQTLPWEQRAWHCGGSANNTHIGVEMCEPDCISYTGGSNFICSDVERAKTMAMTAYNSAVKLFAELCDKFDLNPLTDIISHSEGYSMGIASGHSDPEHLWNGLGLNLNMDTFREAVKANMSVEFKPYKVVITNSYLNVRSGAGLEYPVVTQVHRNEVYTIIDKFGDWGKLKSGAGWIFLKGYTEKL